MSKTIGICGYGSTGSSAVCDLLKEFEDAQVIDDFELSLIYYPDGLQDLDWHLNTKCAKEFGSLPIKRFRRLAGSRGFFRSIKRSTRIRLTNEFLAKIVQVEYNGLAAEERDKLSWFFKRSISIIIGFLVKMLRIKRIPKLFFSLVCNNCELSTCPDNFDSAAKEYIMSLLIAAGYKEDKKVTILNQPFAGNNPTLGFKYFDSPKAIIVNRDARDCYLFNRVFLKNRAEGLGFATDNVDEFIQWYKTVRICPDKSSKNRSEVLYMNFEELVYDYENAVKKVAAFCELHEWIYKGEFFKPNWSRNNTQLYKKYVNFENDIKKIENKLSEYIFPFERYSDIKAVGEMFYGSQSKRG